MNNSKNNTTSRLVYTTEIGRICPECSASRNHCRCKTNKANQKPSPSDGIARVYLETKGRKGKGVTIITGLPLAPNDLDDIAKRLKQKCGSGGTAKEGRIEIQGDHRDLLIRELLTTGYKAKKAGG